MRRPLALRPLAGRLSPAGEGVAARALALAPRPSPGAVAGLLVLLLAATGGWLWLRDSSLVAVRRVQISGLTGPQAGRIRSALEVAARNMSTLHVSVAALRDAASPFPIVRDLRVSARPPHGLRILIEEQEPVAAVSLEGRTVAVAPDGALLRDTVGAERLPLLALAAPPGAERITTPSVRREIALLAAAPAALRARIGRVTLSGAHGMVALVRAGPALYFGGAGRLPAKWAAAAAVLADRTSAGARYVDVRIPERPAAGGVPAPPPSGGAASRATGGAGGTTGPSPGGPGSSAVVPSAPSAPGGATATPAPSGPATSPTIHPRP